MFKDLLGLAKPILDLIDDCVTSDEERARMKLEILQQNLKRYEAEADAAYKERQQELELKKLQAQIILAEATSKSWLARNIRPLAFLVFLIFAAIDIAAALFAASFGIPALPPGLSSQLWNAVMICVGGYIGARSFEKYNDRKKNEKGR